MALFLQAALWIMNHSWNIESQQNSNIYFSMNKETVHIGAYFKKYIEM